MVHKIGVSKLSEWKENWSQFESLADLSDDQLNKRYDELKSKREYIVSDLDDIDQETIAIEELWNVKPVKKK